MIRSCLTIGSSASQGLHQQHIYPRPRKGGGMSRLPKRSVQVLKVGREYELHVITTPWLLLVSGAAEKRRQLQRVEFREVFGS